MKEIRSATFVDAPAIYALIKAYPNELVPRPISDIIQNIDRFVVCERDRRPVGVAAWTILPEIGNPGATCIEIKSVAVDAQQRHHGIGSALVQAVLGRILPLRPAQAIVLTFRPDFFARMGFAEVPKQSLMHKLYMGCINCAKYDNPFTCPEIAMARDLRNVASP